MPAAHLRTHLRRLAITAGISLAAAAALVGTGPLPAADAADLSAFDPGLIISDAIFFDSTTMRASDIQAFLEGKEPGCVPGADGSPCLKDFRQDTATRAATDRCPGGYAGAAGESAATIIDKVSRSCGINPQVILVTLQKEQGLVRASGSGLTATRYRSAMGYGCPDTAACDTTYYGFFNQVYSAAAQFRNYALNPTRYSHRAGVVNNVQYHPNAACGSSAVYIQNQATAGLYNYTPYQPNAAALAAGYGTGDACSSYGNRNFWNYFTDWFGPTTQRAPFGVVDSVVATGTSVTVTGWALDPDTTASIAVHVYVDGAAVAGTTAAIPRADVGAVYRKGDLHGYSVTAAAAAGSHRVCVYAIDSSGGLNPELGCRVVKVVNNPPLGAMDSFTTNGTELTVSGWALDPDTTVSIAVHFYLDGAWTSAVVAGGSRPDVGWAYGKGDAHGFATTLASTPGNHTLCAYAIDTSGPPNPSLGCRTFTLTAPDQKPPLGVVDGVTVNGTTITVSGWAFDPNTVQPIGVQVYVDGAKSVSATANASRPDVGQVYRNGDLHGYTVAFGATPGPHTVCVSALDSSTAAETQLGCRPFTAVAPVVNASPVGVVDSVVVSGTTATVTGWAFDPDTVAPIGVHFYVDQNWGGGTVADQPRADVGAVYGKGDLHGYTMSIPVTTGSHTVCAFGIDASGGLNPALGCVPFTVSGAGVRR
jgi:hypothetical protein